MCILNTQVSCSHGGSAPKTIDDDVLKQSAHIMLSLLLLTILSTATVGSAEPQCKGESPMAKVSTFLGAEIRYDTAEFICCNNYKGHWAEDSFYFESIGFFDRLDPNKETVFYDSVCGIPLFVAPRNRTFEQFRQETESHGWPSFRPEELVSENVIIHDGGRMSSVCGTHLGHNMPKTDGPNRKDRYCIDIVCIAGMPITAANDSEYSNVLRIIPDNALAADEFNFTTYVSKAALWSGKYPTKKNRWNAILICSLIAVGLKNFVINRWISHRRMKAREERMAAGEGEGDDDNESQDDKTVASSESEPE